MIKHISKEASQKENMCSREAVCLPRPVWPQAWALISSRCTLLTSQIPGSTVMLASPSTFTHFHLNNPACEMKSLVPPFLPAIGHSTGPYLEQLSVNQFSLQTTYLGKLLSPQPWKKNENKQKGWNVSCGVWELNFNLFLPFTRWEMMLPLSASVSLFVYVC